MREYQSYKNYQKGENKMNGNDNGFIKIEIKKNKDKTM